jgi:glycosyltransferase involved in cell wall biosynthesis
MRILVITDNHDKRGGGAERFFFYLKKRLQDSNQVFSLGFGRKGKTGKDFKVVKEATNLITRHLWRLLFNPLMYLKLRRYVKKINPDIIHIHNINKYTISILRAIGGYPVVHTAHDYSVVCPDLLNLHKDGSICSTGFRMACALEHKRRAWPIFLSQIYAFYRKRQLLKNVVSQFIVPSPTLRKHMLMQGYDNIEVVPPITDVALKRQQCKGHSLLYVGGLEENKGVRLLLQEFDKLCQLDDGFSLTIVGQGRLRALVEAAESDKVIYKGWQDKLEEIYDEATIVIMPSLVPESFGLVALEAMARSRPVLVSDRGALPWLIGDGGSVFDPCKTGALAQSVMSMSKNLRDLSKKAYIRAKQLSSVDAVRVMRKIYEDNLV